MDIPRQPLVRHKVTKAKMKRAKVAEMKLSAE
jgi:hypothetical protein